MPRQSIITRFGFRLYRLRVEAGHTLPTLEKASGVSRGLLSKAERGMGNPSLLTIEKLALALNCRASDLID